MTQRGELSLSFLDMLSNSLGALLLLFLILATLEHHGERVPRKRTPSRDTARNVGGVRAVTAEGLPATTRPPWLFEVLIKWSQQLPGDESLASTVPGSVLVSQDKTFPVASGRRYLVWVENPDKLASGPVADLTVGASKRTRVEVSLTSLRGPRSTAERAQIESGGTALRFTRAGGIAIAADAGGR